MKFPYWGELPPLNKLASSVFVTPTTAVHPRLNNNALGNGARLFSSKKGSISAKAFSTRGAHSRLQAERPPQCARPDKFTVDLATDFIKCRNIARDQRALKFA